MPSASEATALEALSNDFAAAVERAGQATVAIHARRRIPASGIIWRDGVIVAANHTVHIDDDITVSLADGSSVTATLAGRDPTTDLAVLRGATGRAPIGRAPADALRVGAIVLAVGRPGASVTASMGVISAVGGEWRTWQGGRIDRFVRLDLSVYDGFSGGPLVDGAGRALGVNTSGLSRASAIAIPGATVDRVVDELLARGRVARGYVGLGMQAVQIPEEAARRFGSGDVGLMVVSVEPSGPADAAGILLGDVVLTFDGEPVGDPTELLALLGPERIGKAVPAKLLRAGEVRTIAITVGERPESVPQGRGRRRR
jgi:S1-C subfamily serine protease